MEAGDWLAENGIGRKHWVHKLLMSDLVAEYGLIDNNSALNLIYLLGWSTRRSGGLPLAGTDERFHVVGGNDRVIRAMAAQLPPGTLQLGKALAAVRGHGDGPYALSFSDGSQAECDQLVFAMPYHLIRDVDIDARLWDAFSAPKRRAIANIQPADNGKLQLEFASRYYDLARAVSGQIVHLSAVTYSDIGTARAPGFISTWEGNPRNPSELGIIVNYTGGHAGESLRNATAIPGAEAPYFGEAAGKDVARLLADFEKIWPGIGARYTGRALVSNWWDNPYSRGAFVSPDIGAMTSWWGAQLEREGNIHFAGEACDVEYWSYMNGAIRSGERVAREIAQA
jgi:monoamine oxidase